MDVETGNSSAAAAAWGRASFSWRRLALWLPVSVAIGILTGSVAAIAAQQTRFAPLVFFPLLVGVVLGLLLVGVMRAIHVAHGTTVVVGTVLAVLATIVTQHAMAYWHAAAEVRKSDAQRVLAQQAFPEYAERIANAGAERADRPADFVNYLQRQAARGRPILLGYVARGWVAWLSWAIDGLLVLAAGLAVVLPALRLPYCDQCESWYHTTRSGRVAIAGALRLAQVAAMPPPTAAKWVGYRFVTCRSGCGPTGFELWWRERRTGIAVNLVWLDIERRNRVNALLDELLTERQQKRRVR